MKERARASCRVRCYAPRERAPVALQNKCLVIYKRTGRPAQDGLAQVDYSGRRFGALQRPFSDRAGAQISDLVDYQLRQHLRDACLTVDSDLPVTRLTGRARGRAVTAVCLCSDSRGLGIRTALSKLREMTSRPVPSQAHPPGSCMSTVLLPCQLTKSRVRRS